MLHGFDAIRNSAPLKMKRGWKQIFIAVPAGDAHRGAGCDDARADDIAIIDGVAQGDVRIIKRAKIAHGGEARFERAPCVSCAVQRFARRRNSQPRIAQRVQIECQVRVHIDQAG